MSLPLPDQSKPETPFLKRNVAKLLGYIVERWYPDHAFHGARYAQAFEEFDRKHGDPRHRAAASSLISAVHGAGQSHLTLDIGNLIYNNEIMGDWELEIRRKGHEKAEPTPETPPEQDEAKVAALTLLNTVAASGAQRRRVRIDGAKWESAPEGLWCLTVERLPQIQEKTP